MESLAGPSNASYNPTTRWRAGLLGGRRHRQPLLQDAGPLGVMNPACRIALGLALPVVLAGMPAPVGNRRAGRASQPAPAASAASQAIGPYPRAAGRPAATDRRGAPPRHHSRSPGRHYLPATANKALGLCWQLPATYGQHRLAACDLAPTLAMCARRRPEELRTEIGIARSSFVLR